MNKAIKYNSSTHHVLSHAQFFATPCTVAHQASLSMGFPKQEYWSGLSFSTPGDLPDPGIKSTSPALAGGFFTTEPPGNPVSHRDVIYIRNVANGLPWWLRW